MICHQPRDLPQLGALLQEPDYQALSRRHGETLVKLALRDILESAREELVKGQVVSLESLPRQVERLLSPAQRRVLNATGTVLHTNLGRAPLGDLLTAVASRLSHYSVLEYDLQSGRRGKRGESVERLLRWLTGAEAALMVNNCSAAMILLLTVLAQGKEVVVSRGELVEIGGSFRIPDILAQSGARLVEVGTTNRTRIEDYRRAVTHETEMLLSTHASNFQIVGFTESPTRQELLELGEETGLPVVFDLGSGMLSPLVQGEPGVKEAAGFPLVAFSGDKLLGGPQCGILMGRAELVQRCRKHPFYRALRCDKLTLALMEEVLRRHARDPKTVPVAALLTEAPEVLEQRAQAVRDRLHQVCPQAQARVVASQAQVGGGSLPGGRLESRALLLTPPEGLSAEAFHEKLRTGEPPLVGRVEEERLLLDFRALFPAQDDEVVEALRGVFT